MPYKFRVRASFGPRLGSPAVSGFCGGISWPAPPKSRNFPHAWGRCGREMPEVCHMFKSSSCFTTCLRAYRMSCWTGHTLYSCDFFQGQQVLQEDSVAICTHCAFLVQAPLAVKLERGRACSTCVQSNVAIHEHTDIMDVITSMISVSTLVGCTGVWSKYYVSNCIRHLFTLLAVCCHVSGVYSR